MTDSVVARREFFDRPVEEVARELIGCRLTHRGVGGVIVEAEAYGAADPASHGFRGPTARNTAMFGPPGTVYVYVSYGIHRCMNLVTGPEGTAEAVLVRALEPESGIDEMRGRRGREPLTELCSGPGKVCQALAIGLDANGLDVFAPPFGLEMPAGKLPHVVSAPRIGISAATEVPWRFAAAGSPFLSRAVRTAAGPEGAAPIRASGR